MVRRQLGRRLRALRVAAGKTQDDVAATRLMSLGKLKTVEAGRSMVRPGDVYELGQLYDADPATVAELRAMAVATTQHGWWQEYSGGLVKGFETYLDLEATARRLRIYQPSVVSGLVQTADYALAIDTATADPGLAAETIARNVRLRTQRLPALLRRGAPPRIEVILGEAALRLAVGDEELMAAQRAHLLAVNRLEPVTIKVVTPEHGPHFGLLGPFTLLDFADPEDPSVAFVETHGGNRYDDRAEPVARYRSVFGSIDSLAAPVEEYLT
jgi:transcriptional regulator with XRE-family HTH domain